MLLGLYYMLGGKKSKIVKALKWRIWEFHLSPINSSSSFTSCSSFLKRNCWLPVLSHCQVGRSRSWGSSGRRAVCRLQAELAVVHGGWGLHPQQPFCWSALLLDCLLPPCWERHTEEKGNTFRQFPCRSHLINTWYKHFFQLHHTKMLHLVRLHTGERCAVVWGCVTSTHWCCTCWSSFPGSFTGYTLIG